MDPREELTELVPMLNDIVDRIQPWQLTDPTPCKDFAVRDVLDHMITLGGSFAGLFRGTDPDPVATPSVAGCVPAAEFRKVMDDLLDAVHTPGAMTRTLDTPLGALPGDVFARFVAFDAVIHGWDLATSTGMPWEPSAATVEAIDGFVRSALPDAARDGDTFEDPKPVGAAAGPLEQLVAFSGRSSAGPATA